MFKHHQKTTKDCNAIVFKISMYVIFYAKNTNLVLLIIEFNVQEKEIILPGLSYIWPCSFYLLEPAMNTVLCRLCYKQTILQQVFWWFATWFWRSTKFFGRMSAGWVSVNLTVRLSSSTNYWRPKKIGWKAKSSG